MTEQQLSLAALYAGWHVYHQRLVAAIANLSLEQLALRRSPQTHTVGEIAAHIVASRIDHFHLWMGEGSRDLAALAQWHEEGQPARSASALVTGLESSWHVIQYALTHRSIADLAQRDCSKQAMREI